MAADTEAPDEQDKAETFDETNITPDGGDIAHPDMERDVYDVTAAEDDTDVDGEMLAVDEAKLDPDALDESNLDVLEERDDGIDAPRTFRGDNADRVALGGPQAKDFESGRLSDEDHKDLGYRGSTAEQPPK